MVALYYLNQLVEIKKGSDFQILQLRKYSFAESENLTPFRISGLDIY